VPATAPSRARDTAPSNTSVRATAAQLANGRAIYARSCAACHGPTGAGQGNAPQLGNLDDVAAIAAKIRSGGVEMPPMSALLSTADIDDVARFVAAGLPAQ
jgi:mono/diheme cytochrome c family protein